MARRILLADDSVTAQNMGRRILTDAGYEVITVNNGSAALKRIAEQKPDLIVLDVYMPGYGGLEVCQRLKETRETARIPVLLTVGKLEPFKPEEARRVRADAYIVKPFEASELLTALTRLEDKIVPSGEYKQGRFAKAVAAADSEESDRFGDSETGWKDRLIMPGPGGKAKEKEHEVGVPPAVGTAAARDLGRGADFKPAELKSEFERPIPAGLPADITPEEIAAITAAAAAYGGKTEAPAPPSPPAATEAQPDAAARTESAKPETVAPAAASEEVPAATFATAPEAPPAAESATTSPTPEAQSAAEAVASSESKAPEAQPEPEGVAASGSATSESPAASEPAASTAAHAEVPPAPVANVLEFEKKRAMADPDVVAALASLGIPVNGDAVAAAATNPDLAAVGARASGPRWIGQEVPMSEDEATFILEREMEKAYAAMAAADAARVSFTAAIAATEADAAAVAVVAAPVEVASPVVESAAPAETRLEEVAVAAPVAAVEPVADQEPAPVAATAAESVIPDLVAQTAETPVAAVSEVAVPAAKEESAYAAAAAAGGSAAESVATPELTPPAASGPPALDEKDHQKEVELAAAWANWKHIRESIVDSQLASQVADVAAAELKDAQRAESSSARPEPEAEASAPPSATDSSAIASIVDSVLAELKPKLVEEIARKMGNEGEKKKKKKKD